MASQSALTQKKGITKFGALCPTPFMNEDQRARPSLDGCSWGLIVDNPGQETSSFKEKQLFFANTTNCYKRKRIPRIYGIYFMTELTRERFPSLFLFRLLFFLSVGLSFVVRGAPLTAVVFFFLK
eukprot:TRINITY_DN35978_c0_g1_i1.p1 TRINITY_DN35978_c0_g1~~TRINITY_DN35978_c0_g1_i1.p1  ORF type:complete len:125 (-),score=1.23 TRINITY_DN35978_c0_g1_i1:24-398(-)